MTNGTVEDRLALLERDVARLKAQVHPANGEGNWLNRIAGSMSGHPDFSQVLELGRELRQADRAAEDDDA